MKWLILVAAIVVHAAEAVVGMSVPDSNNGMPSSCLTCHNARNKADCEAIGEYKNCPMSNAACEEFIHYNENGVVDEYSSKCKAQQACDAQRVRGLFAGECKSSGGGPGNKKRAAGLHGPNMLCRHCTAAPFAAECHCKGDPHCSTLDGLKIEGVKSSCAVTMVRDGCDSNDPTFEVVVDIDKMVGTNKYFVRKVIIDVQEDDYSEYMKLSQDPDYIIVGIQHVNIRDKTAHAPLQLPHGIKIYKDASGKLVAKLANEVIITWDFDTKVSVLLPDTFRTKTCGICGNFNGLAADDMKYGPKKAGPACPNQAHQMESTNARPGTLATNGDDVAEHTFAISWFNFVPAGDTACEAECGVQ